MLLTLALIVMAWLAPLFLVTAGLVRFGSDGEQAPWDWQLVIVSTLLCAVAFNLTFLIQELLLVLPKALVPGLKPVLYHNDHSWSGTAAVAELYEGTGAIAIITTGLLCGWAAKTKRSSWLRLFVLWMGFEGLFQGLPQFVLGAILPANDVGRAYSYLHIGPGGRSLIATVALVGIPIAGTWLGRSALSYSDNAATIQDWRGRTRTIAQALSIPALAAVPLIIPFRVPREPVEVVLLPLLVQLMGAGWVLATAWLHRTPRVHGIPASRPIVSAVLVVAGLLAFFQLVLRPGIHFY